MNSRDRDVGYRTLRRLVSVNLRTTCEEDVAAHPTRRSTKQLRQTDREERSRDRKVQKELRIGSTRSRLLRSGSVLDRQHQVEVAEW